QVESKSGFVNKNLPDAAIRGCNTLFQVFGFDQTGKSVFDCITHMLNVSKYEDWLKDNYAKKVKNEYEDRKRNLNELVNSIKAFCDDNPNASLADYLQSIALYTNGDDELNENGVRLKTMHASKGLEFDTVYIVGAEENICPHKRACME